MTVRGDVKCYYCGHISGELIGSPDEPMRARSFRPGPSFRGPLPKPGQSLRCDRCGGPVFLEDVSVVREPVVREPVVAPTRGRRKNSEPWDLAEAS